MRQNRKTLFALSRQPGSHLPKPARLTHIAVSVPIKPKIDFIVLVSNVADFLKES